MRKIPNTLTDLEKRLSGVQKLLEYDDNNFYYDSMRNFLSLKIDELRTRVNEIDEIILAMGELDFSKRLPVDEGENILSYFTTTLNILNEELEARIVPFHFEILQNLNDLIIVTDASGKVLFANKAFEKNCKIALIEIKDKNISDLFSGNSLKINIKFGFTIQNAEVNFRIKNSRKPFPAKLTVTEMKDSENKSKGFIFIAKKSRRSVK
jgi:PAS domain S-box-containing protein